MKKIIPFTIVLVLAMAACKPNAKNEAKYWANNKTELAEAVAKYPKFKTLLDNKLKEAEVIWAAAEKISKAEEKAAKMKEANAKLNELLNQFTQIKYKSKGIESSIAKLQRMKISKLRVATRDRAIRDARNALFQADTKMKTAVFTDEVSAKVVTKDVISGLISAKGALDRSIKSLKK
ncbi:MAG: hypothetical protein AAF518_05585 [Spirochaetota bacterium]